MNHTVRWALLLWAVGTLIWLGWQWRLAQRRIQQLPPTMMPDDDPDAVQSRIDPRMERLLQPDDDSFASPLGGAAAQAGVGLHKPAVLDSLIDSVSTIELEQPVQGKTVLQLLPHTRRVGSKPWVVEGLNEHTQQWEALTGDAQYTSLQAGLQLVNRHGAINEVEFSEFVVKAQGLADVLGASVAFADMRQEVARARELDQFASSHDIRITLQLQAKRAAWSLAYIQQHAYRLGFDRGSIPGQWVLQNTITLGIDSYAAMLEDAASAPIQTMSLNLDVPQVDRHAQPFDLMADTAVRMAAGMEAAIVDEQNRPVDLAAMQRSAAQLEQMYDRMDSHDIPAGSPLAKRLFS